MAIASNKNDKFKKHSYVNPMGGWQKRQENKNDKFKKLATKRVRNVIKSIENIGKLSSPIYEYSDQEVEKIFSALQESLDNVKALFSVKRPMKKEFEL